MTLALQVDGQSNYPMSDRTHKALISPHDAALGQLLTCISMTRSPPLLRPCLSFQRRLASNGTSPAHLRLSSALHEERNLSYSPTAEWRRQSLKGEKNCPKSLYPRYLAGPSPADYVSLESLFGHLEPHATGKYPVVVHGMPNTIIGICRSSYSQEECWSKGQ